MESYQYPSRLEQGSIRLARILLESTADEIHISLEIANLETAPVFDALSYTWGRPCTVFPTVQERDAPPDPPVPVICNGKRLQVSKNLHDYLQIWLRMAQVTAQGTDERVQMARERNMHPPDALWIDAICINQADVIEKNDQVAMMGRIYARSLRVIVWLGPEDVFVRPALELLFLLSSVPISRAIALRDVSEKARCDALGLPPMTSSAWWPVFAFLNRAWFTRAWIVQELALAPELYVMCGMMSFSWPVLAEACSVLFYAGLNEMLDASTLMEMEGEKMLEPHFYDDMMPVFRFEDRPDSDRFLVGSRKGRGNNSSSFVMTLEKIRSDSSIHLSPEFPELLESARYQRRGHGVPFLDLLDELRQADCFDSRDKIYAFIEIAKRPYYESSLNLAARRDLVPDYRLPTAEVYLQAAWYLLLSGHQLDLLSIAYTFGKAEKDQIPDLPAWVPDWSCKRSHTPMTGLHAFDEDKWYATRHSRWTAPDDDRLHQPYLSVQGSLVDTICAVEEHHQKGMESGDIRTSRAAVIAAELPELYPWVSPPQRSGEVFWRTLIADSTVTEHPAPDFSVLFYNDIWLVEMSRAAREQFQSLEKEEEWYRFVHSYSLFGPVADQLKRPEGAEEESSSPSSDTLVADVGDDAGVMDNLPRETLLAIHHLQSTRRSGAQAPKSQLDQAFDKVIGQAGLAMSDDGETLDLDEGDATKGGPETERHESTGAAEEASTESTAPPKIRQDDAFTPEFNRLMSRFTRGRRVFRTERDYLGNGMETLEVGDQVWLVSGAKVPMILRPLGNRRYRFIGDAYVHGIMHGEAWSGDDLQLQDVELE